MLMLDIKVCLLCKNELMSFSKIYNKLNKELKRIKIKYFVIDGGSTDGSLKFYKKNFQKDMLFEKIYNLL